MNGGKEPVEVNPCEVEPCIGARVRYERAKDKASEAATKLQTLLNNQPKGAQAGVSLLGAGLAAAGLVLVLTGVGAPVGGALIAGGAVCGGLSGASIVKWRSDVKDARDACEKAHQEYIAAKEAVMKDCPARCWPQFESISCP